jgi:Putative zinc-finger
VNSEQKVPLLGLSCREASRLISESLDRELSRRERWSLRMHTLLCTACQRFAQQTKMFREAITNMPDALREKWSDSTAKLSAERRTQIKRLLAEARRADSQD